MTTAERLQQIEAGMDLLLQHDAAILGPDDHRILTEMYDLLAGLHSAVLQRREHSITGALHNRRQPASGGTPMTEMPDCACGHGPRFHHLTRCYRLAYDGAPNCPCPGYRPPLPDPALVRQESISEGSGAFPTGEQP